MIAVAAHATGPPAVETKRCNGVFSRVYTLRVPGHQFILG